MHIYLFKNNILETFFFELEIKITPTIGMCFNNLYV